MTWRIYLLNVALALDALVNCLLRGRPGITLSGRAATARRDGRLWGRCLCRVLDALEPGHCAAAIASDAARARTVLDESYL